MRSLLLPAVLALLLSSCSLFVERERAAYYDLKHAPRMVMAEDIVVVINSDDEWVAFHEQHRSLTHLADREPHPGVDFSRHTVVGLYYGAEFFSGCRSYVHIVRAVRLTGDKAVLDVAPVPDLGTCRSDQHPYQVIAVEGKFTSARIRPVPR